MTTDYHRLCSPPNGRGCSGRGCNGRVLNIWGLLPITGSAATLPQAGAQHHTTLLTRSICPFSPHRPANREEREDVRFPLLSTRCMWLSTLYWHTSSLSFSNPGKLTSASRPIRPATVAEQTITLVSSRVTTIGKRAGTPPSGRHNNHQAYSPDVLFPRSG